MLNNKSKALNAMLTSDINAHQKITRLFSYKQRYRYEITLSILETFEKLSKESPVSAIEDLQSNLTKTCKMYEEQLVHFRIGVLYDTDSFPSYAKFRCKRTEAEINVLRYWVGAISCL